MVEREDDELQAGGIELHGFVHGLEITTAVGGRMFVNHHRLPAGIPFFGIEFVLGAELAHHSFVNHLDDQCALFA